MLYPVRMSFNNSDNKYTAHIFDIKGYVSASAYNIDTCLKNASLDLGFALHCLRGEAIEIPYPSIVSGPDIYYIEPDFSSIDGIIGSNN